MTKDEFMRVVANNTTTSGQYYSILDAVERYSSALLQQCNVGGQSKQLPLDFIVWYSGMTSKKILSAYQRYKAESGNWHQRNCVADFAAIALQQINIYSKFK